MQQIFWLAIAGMVGTLSRFGINGFCQRFFGDHYALGTLLVNISGAFFIGLLMESSRQASFISNQTAMIVAVGFLGAFTTFSSLTFEMLTYFQREE
jgi:CrcB protein